MLSGRSSFQFGGIPRRLDLGELVLLLICGSAPSTAQSMAGLGALHGTVTDQLGAGIAKANITLSNPEIGLTREVIVHGKDSIRGLRHKRLPATCVYVCMAIRRTALDDKEADIGVVGGFGFPFPILREAKRQTHVGLAAAKPYVANQDVMQLDSFAARRIFRVPA